MKIPVIIDTSALVWNVTFGIRYLLAAWTLINIFTLGVYARTLAVPFAKRMSIQFSTSLLSAVL